MKKCGTIGEMILTIIWFTCSRTEMILHINEKEEHTVFVREKVHR